MLQINHDAYSTEGSRTNAAYSGTALEPAARGTYEMGNIGVWKILHVSPHAITKGGVNKIVCYTSEYAP